MCAGALSEADRGACNHLLFVSVLSLTGRTPSSRGSAASSYSFDLRQPGSSSVKKEKGESKQEEKPSTAADIARNLFKSNMCVCMDK